MDYFVSDKNTWVWFCFTVYTVSALFIVPDRTKTNAATISMAYGDRKALQFASRLIFRIALIFPMVFIIKNLI
ncbi:hypothetical protein [Myxosarcina sp. GI1(2024)]